MMHPDFQAFTSHTVLESFQKRIEVVEAWDEKVVAGLSDGSVVVLQPDGDKEAGPWQVIKALKQFSKKSVLQMQVWKESSMLLSLDEDGISLFKLPSFTLHCMANRTRYAQRFTWDGGRAMLAVALKKKLLLYHFNGNEFVELKDFPLPDLVSRMAWLGESICLGLKKEFVLLNANTGIFTELFKPGGPCIASLRGDNELLVCKGNVGLILGQDRRVSRRGSLTWSDLPFTLTASHPYAIALLPNYVEIRSVHRISANGLAQVIPIKGMTQAAASVMADGSVLLASGSDGGIRRLQPVPFKQQAETLADAEEFQEALQLASYIPDSEVDKTDVLNALRIRFGHRLFAEGDFDEAMAYFGMCSNASPLVLLNLFPSLAPPTLLEPLQKTIADYKLPELPEPEGESFQKAVEVLLPYLLSHRSRLAAMCSQERDGHPGSKEESSTSGREAAEDTSQLQAEANETGHASLEDLGQQQIELLAAAVDTAILKAMLATSDTGALLRFVQRPNSVDLAAGESALQEQGRYSELVALLQAKGRHASALDILKKVSQKAEDLPVIPQGAAAELRGVTGVWAAVRYLVTVGSSSPSLVKEHARWILKADPEAGLEMFIQMEDTFAPRAALSILTAQAPSLCAPYLESTLEKGSASAEDYHNDLAGIYLRNILSKEETEQEAKKLLSKTASHSLPASVVLDPMKRLKELVRTSEHVDAKHILLMLPSGKLPELRALLLEKMGQHLEALRLYVHTMRSPRLAEAYCDRMHEATLEQSGQDKKALWGSYAKTSSYEMYLALIKVYLEPRGEQNGSINPESSNWIEVARLLGRKHNIIEPLHALSLVPEEVQLETVLPFLEGSLRSMGEKRRNASVVKSLRRSENFQVREENVRCKQRYVVASFERACNICHKRIGNAVIVAYPDNTLAHYSCYKRHEGPAATAIPKVYDISV